MTSPAKLPNKDLQFEDVKECPLCRSCTSTPWTDVKTPLPAVRCSKCDLVYVGKRLTPQSCAKFYNTYNSTRDAVKPDMKEKRLRMYKADVDYVQRYATGTRVLDYGCGTGEFLAMLDGFSKRVGFDIDVDAVENASKLWPSYSFISSVETIGDADVFDTIVFRGTLQYERDLPRLQQFLDQKVCRGGRVILLSVVHADAPLAELTREKWHFYNPVEHIVMFNLSSLMKLFQGYGIIDVAYPYEGTPYARPQQDMQRFCQVCRGEREKGDFAFYGSIMSVVLEKLDGQ